MAYSKAQLRKAEQLAVSMAPDLLAMAQMYKEAEAERVKRDQDERARLVAKEVVNSALACERAAIKQAGLKPINGVDAEYNMPNGLYHRQPVLLMNTQAHPSAIVATILARAERAQAFARVAERSEMMAGDKDAQEGAFMLARMIEEVVDLLGALADHDSVRNAPPSTMLAD